MWSFELFYQYWKWFIQSTESHLTQDAQLGRRATRSTGNQLIPTHLRTFVDGSAQRLEIQMFFWFYNGLGSAGQLHPPSGCRGWKGCGEGISATYQTIYISARRIRFKIFPWKYSSKLPSVLNYIHGRNTSTPAAACSLASKLTNMLLN
jgi:hypothetical protein